eukprot:353388-Chlamydomonas_euryale.AAC.1
MVGSSACARGARHGDSDGPAQVRAHEFVLVHKKMACPCTGKRARPCAGEGLSMRWGGAVHAWGKEPVHALGRGCPCAGKGPSMRGGKSPSMRWGGAVRARGKEPVHALGRGRPCAGEGPSVHEGKSPSMRWGGAVHARGRDRPCVGDG